MAGVMAVGDAQLERARELSRRLDLPLLESAEEGVVLLCTNEGLKLQDAADWRQKPVFVDFVGGRAGHRRRFGGGRGQLVARAVGLKKGGPLRVLDATAGLGQDAFVLATLGCEVMLVERHPLVAEVLADGLRRAAEDAEVAPIAARMQLLGGQAVRIMRDWSSPPPEVVYLDPMYPHRDKSALVKKEMRLFQQLVGGDEDAGELLDAALALATRRVVVKRPKGAARLAGREPALELQGKTTRYDIYFPPHDSSTQSREDAG